MDIGRNIITALIERNIVTDYASEYGEPGYSLPYGAEPHAVVLLGDYWCRDKSCRHNVTDDNGRVKLHGVEVHHPRLWAAMEAQGFQMEWDDEWMVDHENDKVYRTQGDSYSWQPSVIWSDEYEWLTPETDVETWVEWAANDPQRCLTRAVDDAALVELGWEEYRCDYENGWHPGQTDDPTEISRIIKREHGEDCAVLFKLAAVGQFDIRFCAYIKKTPHYYAVGQNIPGYLPMADEPTVFDDWSSAREYVADEIDRSADHYYSAGEIEGDAMGDLLTDARDEVCNWDGPDSINVCDPSREHDLGITYWIVEISQEEYEAAVGQEGMS